MACTYVTDPHDSFPQRFEDPPHIVDGVLAPPDQAKVSVFDRGFLYGDSVYEVIRTYGGGPFEERAHLARLRHSADRIGLSPKWDTARTVRNILAHRGSFWRECSHT